MFFNLGSEAVAFLERPCCADDVVALNPFTFDESTHRFVELVFWSSRPREENATGPGERAGRALVRLWEGVGRRTSLKCIDLPRNGFSVLAGTRFALRGIAPDLAPDGCSSPVKVLCVRPIG